MDDNYQIGVEYKINPKAIYTAHRTGANNTTRFMHLLAFHVVNNSPWSEVHQAIQEHGDAIPKHTGLGWMNWALRDRTSSKPSPKLGPLLVPVRNDQVTVLKARRLNAQALTETLRDDLVLAEKNLDDLDDQIALYEG